MNLISADIPTLSFLFEICTYMYLKHVHVSCTRQDFFLKKSIFEDEIYNHTSFIVSLKISVPFPRGQDIEPLSC